MESSLRARLRLAERYADFGLAAAARATLERARRDSGGDPEALEALCRLMLSCGEARGARRVAAELARKVPGPRAWLLCGEAQLGAGERDAARFSFAKVLESSRAEPRQRARALLGRARVAAAEQDEGGAGAAAMTALGELLAWAAADGTNDAERAAAAAPIERAIELAVRAGRAADAEALLDESAGALPGGFLRALLLLARRAAGDGAVSEGDIEAALSADAAAFLPARLRLAELRFRRRHREREARAAAVASLEALAAELGAGEGGATASSLLASVTLMLAAAYEDEPSEAGRAEAAYRRALSLRPGQLSAATRLAALGGHSGAALEAARTALAIDGASHLAWLAAARLCAVGSPDEDAVAALLEAADPGAGAAAATVCRLLDAAAEVTRAELLAGMHARGHRVKNLLGIIGSRARKARKLAAGEGELADRLAGLEREVMSLFEEWSLYLRSTQGRGQVAEPIATRALIEEVIEAARARSSVEVELAPTGPLPELYGDRLLLREALLNLVQNAVEACADGGQVAVSAELRSSGSAPVLEIAVRDDGPGIGERDLARVAAPGFTTKESGSGLGLAVAERAVSGHRGRLLIDSEEGRGTVVTVLLPALVPGVDYPSSGDY